MASPSRAFTLKVVYNYTSLICPFPSPAPPRTYAAQLQCKNGVLHNESSLAFRDMAKTFHCPRVNYLPRMNLESRCVTERGPLAGPVFRPRCGLSRQNVVLAPPVPCLPTAHTSKIKNPSNSKRLSNWELELLQLATATTAIARYAGGNCDNRNCLVPDASNNQGNWQPLREPVHRPPTGTTRPTTTLLSPDPPATTSANSPTTPPD